MENQDPLTSEVQKKIHQQKVKIWMLALFVGIANILVLSYFLILKGTVSISSPISSDILKNVISVVFAAESTIAVKDRFVSLTSLSKHYLKDLHDILLKFNITNTINKNTLNIYGIYNFHKILDNFDFIIFSVNILPCHNFNTMKFVRRK